MDRIPTRDLLDQTHNFPCPYTFKVIGKIEQGFVARIISIIRRELEHEEDPSFRYRETDNKKYISITVEPEVQSPEQVLAIYSVLSQTDGVIMLL